MNAPRVSLMTCEAAQRARQFFERSWADGEIDPEEAETMEALLAATEASACKTDGAVVGAVRQLRRAVTLPADRA